MRPTDNPGQAALQESSPLSCLAIFTLASII
jgi:hypothetical protein